MRRVVAIDGDIVAFKAAAINEEEVDFGDGGFVVVDKDKAAADCISIIERIKKATGADATQVCLSDPEKNWRKQLEPTYKSHRKDAKKPELIMAMKAFMYSEFGSSVVPWLEADDVMGIMATNPNIDHEIVIASEDKDMRTIPGLVYNPDRDNLGILEIDPVDANQFLLWQAMVGDATDGYGGCPGVGKGGTYSDSPFGCTFKEGAKGSQVHEIFSITDPMEMWDFVLDVYAAKKLTEDDAIHQVRMAHICRYHSYDQEKKQVRLWRPTFLYHY